MFENVPVGVCNNCGYRYYNSKILKKVDDIAEGREAALKAESIPVVEVG